MSELVGTLAGQGFCFELLTVLVPNDMCAVVCFAVLLGLHLCKILHAPFDAFRLCVTKLTLLMGTQLQLITKPFRERPMSEDSKIFECFSGWAMIWVLGFRGC